VDGSDRVEIVWAAGQIRNKYLQVIVAANSRTGLSSSDAFFFGNRVGDSGTSTPPTIFQTTSIDAAQVNATITGSAAITNLRDFNRSGDVTSTDGAIVNASIGTLPRIAASVLPPGLAAQLAVDSAPGGGVNSDGITKFKTMTGTLSSANGIVSFKAGLNSSPVTTDALSTYNSGTGQFDFNDAFMVALNGGAALVDGSYVLHLEAIDAHGLSAAAEVAFTLDTVVSQVNIPDLIAADDTGASSTDNITKLSTPRIDVPSEVGSTVRLFVNSSQVNQGTGGPALQFTLAALANATHTIYASVEDLAGNTATTSELAITVSTVLPSVSLTTLVTISSDLTPHVNVAASGALALVDGTQVTVDVDLDYDGNFSGAGELDRTTSTLFGGKSYFQVTPALPDSAGGAAYSVQLRARVTDVAGNEGTSTPTQVKIDRIGNTVLDEYVTPNPNPTYTVKNTYTGGGITTKVIDLTSQTWLTAADTSKPDWHHWLIISVPSGSISDTALLIVDGGGNADVEPGPLSDQVALASFVASQINGAVAYLRQVPSEPIKFLAEPGQPNRSEDAIIAYTFDRYKDHFGEPGNEDWPALLPMVQSAVAAMDTTQKVIPAIDDFIVTGYSKRGWTTWLTAAMDDRVRAIIPGVIDILNMGEQMVHHWGAYGFFSSKIGDYTAFNIPQESYTVGGQEVGRVVDPYSYIYNGRFDDMPKLLINSSGDEFFLPDSAEFYFSDLPGTDNYLRYIPNTGHGLNETDPLASTAAFFADVVSGTPLPEFSWTVGQDGSINVQTISTPTSVKLWQAENLTNRDFRNQFNPTIMWNGTTLGPTSPGIYSANVSAPGGDGARAFFIELTFPSSNAAYSHVFTTQIKVATDRTPTSWAPFFMPTITPPGGGGGGGGFAASSVSGSNGGGGDGLDGVAFAIAAGGNGEAGTSEQPPKLATAAAAAPGASEKVDRILASDWSWRDDDQEAILDDEEDDDELALILLGDDWL
jgi:PhoPQ-activated pathogenicity-related protein